MHQSGKSAGVCQDDRVIRPWKLPCPSDRLSVVKVSTRLKQLREERGLTRQAVELGCVPPLGKGLISKYEKGKGTKGGQDPNADTVRRLAAFFRV